jgi:hypothetical protein
VKVIRTVDTYLINPGRKISADAEIEFFYGPESFYKSFLQYIFGVRLGFRVAESQPVDHFVIVFVQSPECAFVPFFGQQDEEFVSRVHFRFVVHHSILRQKVIPGRHRSSVVEVVIIMKYLFSSSKTET